MSSNLHEIRGSGRQFPHPRSRCASRGARCGDDAPASCNAHAGPKADSPTERDSFVVALKVALTPLLWELLLSVPALALDEWEWE
jgi:hypothetical protein